MSEDKSAYRQIMKATSIFGGVQVFQILIGIVRSKFIAVLLGPAGMGLAGLLQAGNGMIAGLTNFGLSSSAIKNISAAHAEGDEEKVGRIIAVFRRLVWATGLLGLIITLGLSSYLSQLTFGNKDYTWAFALLSITLLINQISAGQGVLLRAMREVKLMAKSSMIGSVLGLVTTIPLYYFYGMDGIVPALILAAFTSLFLSWYFASKLSFKKVKVDFSTVKIEGKDMLTMGFMISLSGIITLAFSYLVRIFISNYGSVDDVGLYNAGFAIINTYVGMIFTAMATDYYPKLSGVAHDVDKMNQTINQQAEIAILILSPIILVFIVFIKWVVFLLYSEAFLPVNQMILFAAAGMLFKALSWAIAFVFLAKSASKLFFWNELITNIYMLGLNLAGYYWYGLTGLGISFLVTYVLYACQVYLVSKTLFKFKIDSVLVKIFFLNLTLTVICLLVVLLIMDIYLMYLIGLILIVVSAIYNLINLDKRMGLRDKFYGI
ncbi:O-antigen translocase [Cecembia lonarensis]|uniref:O-antigen translocase n=1 Tax=Cecembia lonarensis (strain CCUG 58316 / KCTC 22772 / LW9) TaxID=1225176 RepID=K1LYG7_CECL9|nr:O-antigen translocase [Cecembia lonarensis]EKB49154.1 O-antigen translocase [Cecembia lonarensis LW9]